MNVLLWIWQLPQHVLGVMLILLSRAKRVNGYYTAKKFFNSGISLGQYIILQSDCVLSDTVKHELGHSIQSRWLGPLYLLVVGLPSIARNIYGRLFHKDMSYYDRVKWYYSGYPEKQADSLGGVKRQIKNVHS